MQVAGIEKDESLLHYKELAPNSQKSNCQKASVDGKQWDELWLATGSSVNLTSDPLLAGIAELYPLKVSKNLC